MPPILFQDQRFVVIDKPAGLPVHPGPRTTASVEDLFPALSRRALSRRKDGPWLAHRLDAGTSGCLIIALRRAALIAAQTEFAAGRARKTYWAIVQGQPATQTGIIDLPLLKCTAPQGWRMVAHPSGQHASTHWRALATNGKSTLLELHPLTGRTHQIRVHCAEIGHPILGDPIYADGATGRLQLLARSIALDLEPPLLATAAPLPEMAAMLGMNEGVLL